MTHADEQMVKATARMFDLIESGPNVKIARKRSQIKSRAYADVARLNGDTVADAVLDEMVMPIVFEDDEGDRFAFENRMDRFEPL